MTTASNKAQLFLLTPDGVSVEVASVADLGKIGSMARYEDFQLDQLDYPISRRTRGETTEAQIEVVRIPDDIGQRTMKASAGTDTCQSFEVRLNDGFQSVWSFDAYVTGYMTKFSHAETPDPVTVEYFLHVVSDVVERSNVQ